MNRRWWWTWVVVVAVGLAATSYGDVRAVSYLRTRPDSTSTSTWPRTVPPSASFNDAELTLVKAARNDPTDLSFRFSYPTTRDRWSYLFVDCDSGTIYLEGDRDSDGDSEGVSGPCTGRVHGSIGAGDGARPIAGTVTARVSEPQKKWGVAYYR